jgi:hypothetical protein
MVEIADDQFSPDMLPECNAPPNLLFTPRRRHSKMKEAAEEAYSSFPPLCPSVVHALKNNPLGRSRGE